MRNECADHAEAFRALGLVSNRNPRDRWPPFRFDASNLLRNCNDHADT